MEPELMSARPLTKKQLSRSSVLRTKPPKMVKDNERSDSVDSASRFALGLALYVGTGVCQPVLIDGLRLRSLLGPRWLLLPTLANVMGMTLVGLLEPDRPQLVRTLRRALDGSDPHFRRRVFTASAVDLVSGMSLMYGLSLTGGAIFVVLYNSCPVWTALLSRYVLGRRMSWLRWAGVLGVCAGLIAHVRWSEGDNTVPEQKHQQPTRYSSIVLLGSVIVLVGSFLHSLMFVISERSLQSSKASSSSMSPASPVLTGATWSCCMGSLETCVMSVWVLIGLNVSSPLPEYLPAMTGLALLVVVDAIHAASFFALLQRIGAVASALLKGVQTVVVVAISAVVYCPPQCLTPARCGSTALVLSGVLCYGIGGGGSSNDSANTNDSFNGEKDRDATVPLKETLSSPIV